MVYITNSVENPEKTAAIIDAAQKRFGIYGLEKTTMREIASDLGMSKGSLYYYFPDKEQLYRAVVEKEQDEFVRRVTEKIKLTDDPCTMLKEYVDTRLMFFKLLVNLGRLRYEDYSKLKPIMGDLWQQFRRTEVEMISEILNRGIEKGIFFITDKNEIAGLFLDLLKGLAQIMIKGRELFYLDQDEYNSWEKKVGMLTEIFIRGLRNAK